ncbi:MAG: hypothetical protein ACP5NV_01065 [Candidatus Woesearchaeota archaeon]
MNKHINDTITEAQAAPYDMDKKGIISDIILGSVFTIAGVISIAAMTGYFLDRKPVEGVVFGVAALNLCHLGQIFYTPPSQRNKDLILMGPQSEEYVKFMNEKYNKELKEYFNLGVKGIN